MPWKSAIATTKNDSMDSRVCFTKIISLKSRIKLDICLILFATTWFKFPKELAMPKVDYKQLGVAINLISFLCMTCNHHRYSTFFHALPVRIKFRKGF